MAYNLPPPWDPGFALPKNVEDEGLERRGFVTRMLPRGTYDDPKVGTGGYTVPGYVVQEGYGQGAYGTRWARRGRFDIPVPNYLDQRPQVMSEQRLPGGGTKVTFDALSGVESAQLPAGYVNFGQKAAALIVARVQSLPQATRKTALKKIVDAIDKTLWKRTETIANQLAKQGVPPMQAVASGLARSISEGAAKEIVAAGKSGRAPAVGSLMGLGCYGSRARSSALGSAARPGAVAHVLAAFGLGDTVPTRAGYCWNVLPDGTGYWSRAPASGCPQPQTTAPTAPTPTVRTSGGGVTVTDTATGVEQSTVAPGITVDPASRGVPDRTSVPMLEVGPFKVPADVQKWTVHVTSPTWLPASWSAWLIPQLGRDADKKVAGNASLEALAKLIPGLPAKINGQFINQGGNWLYGTKQQPIFVVTRADKASEQWGVYATMAHAGGDSSKPYELQLSFEKLKPEDTTGIWGWIKRVAGKVVDVVSDIVDKVGDLACSLANSGNAEVMGAAVGIASGAGPAVGVAGAQVVKGACYTPPPPPPPDTGGGSILPLAIAGVGIAGLAYYLTRKKK